MSRPTWYLPRNVIHVVVTIIFDPITTTEDRYHHYFGERGTRVTMVADDIFRKITMQLYSYGHHTYLDAAFAAMVASPLGCDSTVTWTLIK
jgi:hypothetical protein